jgi:hypothetical protein
MSRLLLLVALLISLIFIPLFTLVQAATPVTITLDPAVTQYKPGDLINIPIHINTQSEGIYSVQTDISFPADQLEVSNIDTTNSVFPLQVINTYSPGKISLIRGSFSPINTANGLIATIQLKALKTSVPELVFDPTTVALNATGTNQTTALGTTLTITAPLPSATPVASSFGKVGDIDGNGKVDIFDYNILLTNFGKSGSAIQGDLDSNGKVDIFDYNSFLTNYGK